MKYLIHYSLYIVVFLSALQVVIARHDARRLFIELQTFKSVRDELNEEWVRLQLEQSTWAMDDRIEVMAGKKLNMKMPDNDSIIVLTK